MTEQTTPAPRRYLVKPVSLVLGLLAGAGVGIFQQQAGGMALSSAGTLILFALAGALVFGFLVPTLILNLMLSRQAKEVPK